MGGRLNPLAFLFLWTGGGLLGLTAQTPVQPNNGPTLKVYTQNLHTWQESQPREKLARVADFIAQEDMDIVLLQECGQHQEGVAILTRHPILRTGEKVVSADDDLQSPSRRVVLWADIQIPQVGELRTVSAHLGWSQDQDDQIQETLGVFQPGQSGLLGGDYNMEPTRTGYNLLKSRGLRDNFLTAGEKSTPGGTMGGRRIDYLWTNGNFPWGPQKALTVFRPRDYSYRRASIGSRREAL